MKKILGLFSVLCLCLVAACGKKTTTTKAPTTQAPTTVAPTTVAPTTTKPTTAAPTTAAPTTKAPTTAAPTTAAPTTQAPTTAAPTTAAPTTTVTTVDLAAIKAEVLADLDLIHLASYRAAQQDEIAQLIADHTALIEAKTTVDEIYEAYDAAVAAIAAVKTNVQLLVEELGEENVNSADALKVDADAEGDAFAIWTVSGTKIREIDVEANSYSWLASPWRYYVVFDAEGRITYACVFSDAGYGGPTGKSFYCHPVYDVYTDNPSISVHESFEPWPASTQNMYEIVIPEGGFALSAHGSGISALLTAFTGTEMTFNDQALGDYNNRNIFASSLRVAYDAMNKSIVAYHDPVEVFKAAHAEVLALTVEEVSLANVEALKAAEAAVLALPEAAQAALAEEIAHLQSLAAVLTELVELQAATVASLDAIVLKSYDETNAATIVSLVAQHKEAVQAAVTLAAAQEAALSAQEAIAAVETKAQALVKELGEGNSIILNALAVNADAGGDAISIWTKDGEKIREVTSTDPLTYGWIASPWRYYLIFDAEGRMMYATIFPDSGYGGPHSTTFAAHPLYQNTDTNPAYSLLDGYHDWVAGQTAHNLYELAIPEGGFALSAHGLGINELLTAFLGTETVFAENQGDFNTSAKFAASIRVEFDATNKTLVVYQVEEPYAYVKTLNADAGADAIGVYTDTSVKLRTNGTWLNAGWRYFVVVDAQGKIAYAVCMPPNGYGGPVGKGYYAHPSYDVYTDNPAIVALEGYPDNGQAFDIVIPEGGFAITAHGAGITALAKVLSKGEINYTGNPEVAILNSRSAFASNIRVKYNAQLKAIEIEEVEEPTVVSVEEALAEGAKLDGQNRETSKTVYSVTGVVSIEGGKYYLTEGSKKVQVYGKDYTGVYSGYTLTLEGNLQNYYGTIEVVNFKIVKSVPVKYTVTIDEMVNGSVSTETMSDLAYGAEVTFTVTVNEGYKVDFVKVNGVSVTLDENNQFKHVMTSDALVTAVFKDENAQEIVLTSASVRASKENESVVENVSKSYTQNGVTLTNYKEGSSSWRTGDTNARCYQGTKIEISYEKEIHKIEITCEGSYYLPAGTVVEGATYVLEGNKMIFTLDTPATTFAIQSLAKQIRIVSLDVFYVAE